MENKLAIAIQLLANIQQRLGILLRIEVQLIMPIELIMKNHSLRQVSNSPVCYNNSHVSFPHPSGCLAGRQMAFHVPMLSV